ncbi:proline-rich nuclear receptor coactivator 1-like [Salvelinus fontinalis]|uniref:proline-rich nuclear receptor coactivator 1-like n=1 Tax=Salvelinus fontinalis TaxID=8038 RepID=UPI00248677C0|nr:proline-rich nuclear receptor coactivator 1-like [Salvelinus fontinalis]
MEGSGGLFDRLRILRRQPDLRPLSPPPLHADHSDRGLFPRKWYILLVGLIRVMKEKKGFCLSVLLKSKNGRVERATTPGDQSVHNLDRLDQAAQNLNTRSQRSRHVIAPCNGPSVQKYDNSCHTKPNSAPIQLLRREEKNPFNSVDNVKIVTVSPAELVPEDELKDGEKIYAGAKFSEPPSPSVLPKPPSHWVGETAPQHSDHSREQITFHLKSLLKVQDKP